MYLARYIKYIIYIHQVHPSRPMLSTFFPAPSEASHDKPPSILLPWQGFVNGKIS